MAFPTPQIQDPELFGTAIDRVNTHFSDASQHTLYGRVAMGWSDTLANFVIAQPGGATIGWAGQLLEVEVNFTTPGTTQTVFQIDKGAYVSDTAAPAYAPMLSSALTMPANVYRRFFDVASQNIVVAKMDLIRLPVPTSKGTGAAGFYVTTRWRITG